MLGDNKGANSSSLSARQQHSEAIEAGSPQRRKSFPSRATQPAKNGLASSQCKCWKITNDVT